MKPRYFLFFAFLLSLTACTTIKEWKKMRYLTRFESFLLRIDAASLQFASEDWAKADIEFQKLARVDYNYYENQLSVSERAHVNQLCGRYMALKVKFYGQLNREKIEDLINKGAGFIEELVK